MTRTSASAISPRTAGSPNGPSRRSFPNWSGTAICPTSVEGRTNIYRIEPGKLLRHPAEAGLPVAALLALLIHDEADRGDAAEQLSAARQRMPLDGG